MPATVIDGSAVAQSVRDRVGKAVTAWVAEHGSAPGLATVLVGDDPASHVYVGNKKKACEEAGMVSVAIELPAETTQEELLEVVRGLNRDGRVHGMIVQLPLPDHIDANVVVGAIDPLKDVDGLTPTNAGLLVQGRDGLVPATPSGVIELLHSAGTPLEGAGAVVLGRSILVGKPMAMLLLAENATVTVCHSRTRNLPEVCAGADVLVAAIGKPRFVTAEMVKEGATVMDVGINRTDEGLVGDVDFEPVAAKAAAITPVPRGVGPMTIAMLLENTLKAARLQESA